MRRLLEKSLICSLAILSFATCGPGIGEPEEGYNPKKMPYIKPVIPPKKKVCVEKKPLVMFVAEASDAMNTPAFLESGANPVTKWELTSKAIKASVQEKHNLIRGGQYIFPMKSFRKSYEVQLNGTFYNDLNFCKGYNIMNNMKRCMNEEGVVEIIYEKECAFECNSTFGYFPKFRFFHHFDFFGDYLCSHLKCKLVPKKKIVYIQPCKLGPIEEPIGSPAEQLISKLNQIDPAGNSPIAGALQIAGNHIESMDREGIEAHIILITSGNESCSGNPVQVAKELRKRGIFVNVVSFENTNKTALLNELAEAGGRPLEGDIKYREMRTGEEIKYLINEIVIANNQEECNNKDDDCDGLVDEDIVRECEDSCGGGVQFCKNGIWGGCVDPLSIGDDKIPDISPEICDGVDNNCNGEVDELFPVGKACSKTNGSCISVGEFVCSPDHSGVVCNATMPVSVPEICDNKDNDCDGNVDEELTLPCENSCGKGYKSCSAGQWSSCQITKPHAELCNGSDDDCDGLVDEGFNIGKECSVGSGQCVKTGKYVCSSDGLTSECSVKGGGKSGVETCNGLDDDCDGLIDNGKNLCPKGQTCHLGVCITD